MPSTQSESPREAEVVLILVRERPVLSPSPFLLKEWTDWKGAWPAFQEEESQVWPICVDSPLAPKTDKMGNLAITVNRVRTLN